MINIKNIEKSEPYKLFMNKYKKAIENNQKYIEAAVISSFDKKNNEVDCRFVNIKYIENNEWTFFSNYQSPKAKQFKNHNQISVAFFWNSLNIQIRMKSIVYKSSEHFSDSHFNGREKNKNALAISSMQSSQIEKYEDVLEKYNEILQSNENLERPNYWGGYTFKPYYFEFWEGHDSRINKREAFELKESSWRRFILQP